MNIDLKIFEKKLANQIQKNIRENSSWQSVVYPRSKARMSNFIISMQHYNENPRQD